MPLAIFGRVGFSTRIPYTIFPANTVFPVTRQRSFPGYPVRPKLTTLPARFLIPFFWLRQSPGYPVKTSSRSGDGLSCALAFPGKPFHPVTNRVISLSLGLVAQEWGCFENFMAALNSRLKLFPREENAGLHTCSILRVDVTLHPVTSNTRPEFLISR